MKQDKHRLNGILLVLTLALLTGRAEAVTYTWTNMAAGAVWNVGGNWSPSGGPPAGGDTGIVNNAYTCIANTNLTGGPTIEVRTNAVLKWGNGADIALSGHTLVLNGGKFESNCGGKGTVSSTDTIALEADSVIHAGISGQDNLKCTIGGPIQNGPGGGQGKLTLDTSYLIYGNGNAYLIISSTNNTYSGGTVITSATYTAGYPTAANHSRPVYVTAPGGLGLGDVLVGTYGMLLIQATNTTAVGKVITVSTNGYLMEGTAGTFNSRGHTIRLLNGSYFRSGGLGANNNLNCYDAISVEGTVYVQKLVETGDMTLYGAISNGASAGKLVIQPCQFPASPGYVYLANPGNTFSGGLDVQAASYLGFISNNVAGSGPITLLATNSYLYLNQTPDADWTVTNNLAGNGTIKVEDGNGANRLTCGGVVNPGTNGTPVTTNATGILTVNGAMGFAPGSQLTIDIASTNGVAGVDFDRLVVNYVLTNLNNATLYVNVATNLARNALMGQELIVVTNSTALKSTFGTVTGSGDGAGKFWTCTVVTNQPSGTVKLTQLYLRNPNAPIVDNANGATNVQGNNAWLNGTLVSTGAASASVSVYWGTNDGVFVKSAWGHTNDFGFCTNGQALTTNVTLSPGTKYYYRFYATNTAGYDEWAELSTFTTPDFVPPQVTTNTGATAVEKSTATLNGVLTGGGTAQATIYWGQNTNAWANTNAMGAVVQDTPFSTNITGLTLGTLYYYRCYVTNVSGEGYSEIASFTTKPAAQYTWKIDNGLWDAAGNWNPTGGPPGLDDTGILTGLTCIANGNLTGGPTIEVRTNASLYCGNGAGATFGGHTIVLNGGRWVLNSGTKGIITSSDTVALESDSEMRAGINSDDQQWTLSGLIRDGLGGGKGKLTLNTTGLVVGNEGRGLVDITGINNTYSGGTMIFSDTNVNRGPVRVFAPGGLGLSNVLVSTYGYLNIGATNTTAAGTTITVEDKGVVLLGIGEGGITFNCQGHNFLLKDGSSLRSGLALTVNNVVNSYDSFGLEGTVQFKNDTGGSFYLYGPVTNGVSAGKMVVQASKVAGYYLRLCNPSNTFSGGLDIQAGGYASIATNDAYGRGSITLLDTNSYLYLNQTTDADWNVTNNLAGKGTITVEAGDGVKKLTCTGTVDPGTHSVSGVANGAGILRVDGNVVLGAGSRVRIDITGTNGVAGLDYDRLVVDHTLSGLSNAVLEIGGSTNLVKTTLTGQELVVVTNAASLADVSFFTVQWNAPWRGKVLYNDPPGTVKLIEVTSASSPGTLLRVQ